MVSSVYFSFALTKKGTMEMVMRSLMKKSVFAGEEMGELGYRMEDGPP